MLVAHVNGHCVETCVNIKLPFFLHLPISLKKISFNIVGHGMDLIVEVLLLCLRDPTYLHIYDNEFDDEEVDEDHFEKPWVVDMCELMKPNDTSSNVKKKEDHNQPSSSSTFTKKMLTRMGDIMQEIINEVKEGGVQLIDHTTSLLRVIAIDVRGIHLPKVNEVMHPGMVFHCVNDGLHNSGHRMKDWHETMLEHGNIRKRRARE